MTDVQQAVAEAVSALRPEIVAALQELVRIPSQTGREGLAQEAVARLMRAHGLDVDVWEPDVSALEPHAESVTLGDGFTGRPNVVGVCRGEGRGRSLILNGHIDTVEVGDPSAWSYAPLGGDVVDGRLYGRGACDMKGGVVANLFAVRALRQAGFAPAGDVIVQSTISEEDGGAGALAAVLRGYRCRRCAHLRANEPGHRDRAGRSADVPARGAGSLGACLRPRRRGERGREIRLAPSGAARLRGPPERRDHAPAIRGDADQGTDQHRHCPRWLLGILGA